MTHKALSVVVAILSIFVAIFLMAPAGGNKPPPEPEPPATILLDLLDETLDQDGVRNIDPIDVQDFTQFSLLATANVTGTLNPEIQWVFTTDSGELAFGGKCTIQEFNPTPTFAPSFGVAGCGLFDIKGPF